MIADPEKSLEYFESAAAGEEDDAEFGTTLIPISTPADYESAISSPGPVVVRTCSPIPMHNCRPGKAPLHGAGATPLQQTLAELVTWRARTDTQKLHGEQHPNTCFFFLQTFLLQAGPFVCLAFQPFDFSFEGWSNISLLN
jgi:hypothetical protein